MKSCQSCQQDFPKGFDAAKLPCPSCGHREVTISKHFASYRERFGSHNAPDQQLPLPLCGAKG